MPVGAHPVDLQVRDLLQRREPLWSLSMEVLNAVLSRLRVQKVHRAYPGGNPGPRGSDADTAAFSHDEVSLPRLCDLWLHPSHQRIEAPQGSADGSMGEGEDIDVLPGRPELLLHEVSQPRGRLHCGRHRGRLGETAIVGGRGWHVG